jgi:hypothetical protein
LEKKGKEKDEISKTIKIAENTNLNAVKIQKERQTLQTMSSFGY